MKLTPTLAVIAAGLILASCTTPAAPTSAPTPDASTSTPPASPSSTPTPEAPAEPTIDGLTLGTEAVGRYASWTAYETKRLDTRPGGEESIAALLKTCITSDELGNLTITPRLWTLVGPDSETYPPSSVGYHGDPTPQFNADESKVFAKGQCSKGWVVFDVPAGDEIVLIRYQNDTETHEWVTATP